jgi:hypothetical protein
MPLSSTECKPYRIYALIDPSTDVAHYVGQTAGTLGYRRLDHMRKPGNTKKGDWVRALRDRPRRVLDWQNSHELFWSHVRAQYVS